MRWWLTFRFGTVRCSFYFDFRIIRCPYDESDDDSEPYRERMTRARAARFGVFASDPANRRRERVCRGTGESGERRSIANHLVSQTYDPSLLARRAVAFQLAARAGAAVRAAAFQPTMRAGVAVRAPVFPLAMRTRFAVRALAFQLAMRAGLQSAQLYFTFPCGQGWQSAHMRFRLPCGQELQAAQSLFSLPCGHRFRFPIVRGRAPRPTSARTRLCAAAREPRGVVAFFEEDTPTSTLRVRPAQPFFRATRRSALSPTAAHNEPARGEARDVAAERAPTRRELGFIRPRWRSRRA